MISTTVLIVFLVCLGVVWILAHITEPKAGKEVHKTPWKWGMEQSLTEKMDITKVNEPVISFVECVKNNRKRFTYEVISGGDDVIDWKLTDTFTGKSWAIRKYCIPIVGECWDAGLVRHSPHLPRFDSSLSQDEKAYEYTNYPEWLNKDEVIYIYRELNKFYSQLLESKSKRRQQLAFRAKRDKEKNLLKERQLMIDTYCGGE